MFCDAKYVQGYFLGMTWILFSVRKDRIHVIPMRAWRLERSILLHCSQEYLTLFKHVSGVRGFCSLGHSIIVPSPWILNFGDSVNQLR